VLLALGAGAFLFFAQRPVEVFIALGVGPVMRADDGSGIAREEVKTIRLKLHDETGERVAESVMHLASGIEGPAAPAMVVRVPPGDYLAAVQMQSAQGRLVSRETKLSLEEPGYMHVDLD